MSEWTKVHGRTEKHRIGDYYRIWVDDDEAHCWWVPGGWARTGFEDTRRRMANESPMWTVAEPHVRQMFADIGAAKRIADADVQRFGAVLDGPDPRINVNCAPEDRIRGESPPAPTITGREFAERLMAAGVPVEIDERKGNVPARAFVGRKVTGNFEFGFWLSEAMDEGRAKAHLAKWTARRPALPKQAPAPAEPDFWAARKRRPEWSAWRGY